MHAPASAVGNAADLLDVDVHHVPGVSGDDRVGGLAVVGPAGGNELTAIETEADEVAADGADRDGAALGGEFEGDAAS